jgi:hypothetical protein
MLDVILDFCICLLTKNNAVLHKAVLKTVRVITARLSKTV